MKIVRKLEQNIGVEVSVDVDTLLNGDVAGDIRRLLHEHGVIYFGAMNLTDEQHHVLGNRIARVGPDYANAAELELLLANKDYERGAFLWHIDDITEAVPHFGSIMTSRRLAPVGGQTEFANAAAAYDDLPDAEKQAIENLRAVHSFEAAQLAIMPDPDPDVRNSWRAFGSKVLPLVWRHGSGRRSLILGSTFSHVEGIDREAGQALVDRLTAWATQPRYVYSHDWRVGDLIAWDNTITLHRAQPYPIGCERASMRVALAGEEAVP
jgi:alpha-ketoglutarate-dependent taurine dioxygenase